VDELIVASRAVHFVAVALLFGAPLFRLAVAPDGHGVAGGRAIELAAGLAALASALGWFVGVAATMAGSWSDVVAPDILQAVADTRFGRLWIVRLGLIAALLAVQAGLKPSRAKDIALVIVAAVVTASLIGVGHGLAGAGDLAPIHAVADMTHLLCAATWIGGLFCLGQVVRAAATGAVDAQTIRVVLPRFSRVGFAAVALLVVSGCVNALVLVPRPAALISTDYGRVLLVKIALAALMVVIAVVNRIWLTPRLMATTEPAGLRTLWRSVLVEQGVGLLVLVTVARLGTIHPV
jgi:copper resistance protein D